MAIGRITGSVLKSNLTRNGVDLAFETNLLYLDVTNSRVGIGTSEPSTALHVVGTTTTDNLIVNNITSNDSTAIQINDAVNVSGALTANSSLTANTYLQMGNGSATTLAAGRLWYDESTGAWNAGMGNGNITQQIGEELFRYGKASAAITDSPLQLIYKTGVVGGSGVITFAPAVAGITNSDQIIGCATESIALGDFGRVTTYGVVNNIATNGTAYGETWADNDDIYYNPATGGLTKTLPTTGLKLLIGTVITAGSGGSGKFIVKLGSATYLSNLTDVTITSAQSNDILRYNGGNWINSPGNITLVGDDSTGTTVTIGETFKIAGTSNITTAVSGDTLTITGSKDINVNSITSSDSSAIQINDAVNVSGTLTASIIQTNVLSSTESTAIQVNDSLNASGTITASGFVTHGTSGNITGVNNIELNQISSNDSAAVQINDSVNVSGTLNTNGLIANGITYPSTDGSANQVLTTNGTGQLSFTSLSAFTGITFVGDDSSGSTINTAETLKFAGAGGITTSVSGDVLTITGSNPAQGITIVGDDSTGTRISDGETVKIAGTSNISTAMSGDTLTITGSKDIDINSISSSDSSAIQINDGVNVSGTLNAKTIVTTDISSEDSTAVSINDGLNVSGNLNLSGTAKLSGFTYPTVDGTDGQVLTTNGAGTLTFTTVSGGGGGSSATDTITYTGFGSNNVVVDSNVTVGSVDSSNSIGSAVKVVDSFAETAYDSAFYFATTFNDSSNEVGTRMVSLLTNGTTAYNSPGIGVDNGTTSQISFSSNQTGTTVALNALGNSPANTATFHRIGLGTNTTEATSGNISTIINNDINNTPVVVDANVSVGQVDTAQAIGSSTGVVDSFAPTAIDSAFYFAVTEDTANDQLGTVQISLMHNTANAYVASGAVTKTDIGNQLSFSASVHTSGNVRLSATGSSPTNTTRFYKIGLGDSTTAASSGNTATILNTDVDSTVENLDSWSAATYRGARYYISCTAGNGEVSNIEALVVHDGTDAYISTFNEIYSGNNSIITLTADISAGNVRLRASCATNTSVKCYRIRLGDAESTTTSTYNKTVGAVTVSSSATAMDTFSSSSYAVAHYVVVAYNSSESAASISDVYVVTDGTNAFVSNSSVSSKTSDQLIFSVSHDGSDTVTLSAASTSGSSTTVNAYRTQLARADTLSTSTNIDSWSKTSYRGAKYFISIKATDTNEVNNMEAMITHDGTNAYISVYNEVYSGSSKLATLTADISGSNVVLNASSAGERNITFTMYRVLLSDAEATSSGTYNNVIEATTVSSADTALDTFSTESYVGAHYIVVSYNSSESAASISEVFVASDGTTASVASNFVSSKNSAQLSFSVDCSGGVVTLSAASTSGSNTTVNAYRTHLGRPPAASGFKVIDSWSASSYRMAKYIIAIKGTDINEYDSLEATIMHDGSDAYISTYNLMMSGSTYSAPGMITLSADVSGGLVRLKGVSTGEQNMRVTAVRHRVPI